MGPETGEFSPTNSLPARLTSSADSDRLQSLDDRSPLINLRTLFRNVLQRTTDILEVAKRFPAIALRSAMISSVVTGGFIGSAFLTPTASAQEAISSTATTTTVTPETDVDDENTMEVEVPGLGRIRVPRPAEAPVLGLDESAVLGLDEGPPAQPVAAPLEAETAGATASAANAIDAAASADASKDLATSVNKVDTTQPNQVEPAGFRTDNGYTWADGKSVILTEPMLRMDFDKVMDTPLVDVKTGLPRKALPLHTEMRTLLDQAGADRLLFDDDPTLATRLANKKPVTTLTVDGSNPRENPDKIFLFQDIILRPTDDPTHPNDILVKIYFNPDCPTPAPGDVITNGVVRPNVIIGFYSSITATLAEIATTSIKNLSPNTRFSSSGIDANTPVSRLWGNLMALRPVEIAA